MTTATNTATVNNYTHTIATPNPGSDNGCGLTDCQRTACGTDDFEDYGSGFNEGKHAYDNNLHPQDIADMPARPINVYDCAWLRGIHDGWLSAKHHAERASVIPDDNPK